MSRFPLIAVACLPLVGCFFVDPINQRPSLEIQAASSDPVFRGDTIALTAITSDPENGFVALHWRMYACNDALTGVFDDASGGCDHDPFEFSGLPTVDISVPVLRAGGRPVEALLVKLDGTDELGASAKPEQQLAVTVLNRPPDLDLRKVSRYAYVKGTPIDLFAKVADLDDGREHVTLSWVVYAPSQVAYDLTDYVNLPQDPADATHLQYGKHLTPMGIGDWDVEVTAKDPLDNTTVKHLLIAVADDKPPCLAQLSPIVPPANATLPISTTTLFSAPVVIDDLDVYPPAANDPVLGTTGFAWSIQGPTGGLHVPIPGAATNSLAVDPASYRPGDVIEVRVQIKDRNPTTLPCPDSEATCSIATPQSCIQRQTWRVEIR